MALPKIRKKKKKVARGGLKTRLKVRLTQEQCVELQRMAVGGGLEMAKRRLRTIYPKLDDEALHEVAWRCEDPVARGGIEVGQDARGNAWADIAVTV